MLFKPFSKLALTGVLAVGALLAFSQNITGTGASFVFHAQSKWSSGYAAANQGRVNYEWEDANGDASAEALGYVPLPDPIVAA